MILWLSQYADNASLVNHGVIKSDNGSVFDTNNAVSVNYIQLCTIKTLSGTTDNILTGDNTDFTNIDGITNHRYVLCLMQAIALVTMAPSR